MQDAWFCAQEAPSEHQDVPSQLQDAPTELQDAPSELQDVSSELQDAPIELQEAPSEPKLGKQAREAGSGSRLEIKTNPRGRLSPQASWIRPRPS